jgi:hypothetical protein
MMVAALNGRGGTPCSEAAAVHELDLRDSRNVRIRNPGRAIARRLGATPGETMEHRTVNFAQACDRRGARDPGGPARHRAGDRRERQAGAAQRQGVALRGKRGSDRKSPRTSIFLRRARAQDEQRQRRRAIIERDPLANGETLRPTPVAGWAASTRCAAIPVPDRQPWTANDRPASPDC